ncbi:response regulator transcription factor [Calidithermus chliarophilus]|uniref:response regulator transcription factor n=1 Tax=Calidithermus chliarophilus TaxID=52023 RepID=UPI000403F3B1|nr:response regulator [Calidithermus chliarophilus]
MKRILVVDDDPSVRRFLQRALGLSGYTVETLASGEECLHRLEADRPDLLILDLMMPGLDGKEVLHHLDAQGIVLKTVVLSAKDEEENQPEDLVGAAAYLVKPVNINQLLDTVNGLLGSTNST